MNLVLLGAPGSGKGTQAALLKARFEVAHISTGDMLRAAVKEQTQLGLRAQVFMEAGKLVPDDLIVDLIEERLGEADCRNGFLLDGFPRNTAQAESLDVMLERTGKALEHVVYVDVPENEVTTRLLKRAELEGRADDNAATIAHRMEVFRTRTLPLVAYYETKRLLRRIDGLGTVEAIASRITQVLQTK